ncbi:MAG: hypothetical protein KKC21_04490 [Nitrospinae bacterium]|nr:hypothetical protein [Nitrospinota bacterium]
MDKNIFKKVWHGIIIADYYLAASLLLIASILKISHPAMSELLAKIAEYQIVSFGTMVSLTYIYPWIELIIALYALIGWRGEWTARGMAFLYIFFSLIILIGAEGNIFSTIDCGCFGLGEGSPIYWLLLRNVSIAIPLLFFKRGDRNRLLFYRLPFKTGAL